MIVTTELEKKFYSVSKLATEQYVDDAIAESGGGAQGPQGADGADGPQGPQGAQGAQGPQGAAG